MTVPATDPTAFRGPETVSTPSQPEGPTHLAAVPDPGPDRRRSGRRARARDRLMDRAHTSVPRNEALTGAHNIENLLLFVDDDLRETALAIHHIEHFLLRTLGLLEAENLRREDVHAVARDTSVLDHVDMLNETLESLRRRLAKLAARMK